MFNYKEVNKVYQEQLNIYKKQETEYRRLKEKHRRLQKKYEELGYKLQYPHWMEEVLTPLAEELITHFPESHFEVSGVFGLCAETSISIYRKNNSLIAFLQFVPNSDNDLLLRDYTVDRQLYAKGSIGEMNGANHPDIPIPQEKTIEWLLEKIKYFDRTVSTWESSKPKATV